MAGILIGSGFRARKQSRRSAADMPLPPLQLTRLTARQVGEDVLVEGYLHEPR